LISKLGGQISSAIASPRRCSRWRASLSVGLVGPSLLLASLAIGCGDSSTTGASGPSAQQVVGVSGNQMTLDGSPWLSRGVVLQGFIRPLALLKTEAPTDTQAASLLKAQLSYGPAELVDIHAYHADTIRFQISQPALDPNSALYDPQYFNDVVSAIKAARSDGFVVLIMMQDETITGDTAEGSLPTLETQNDWDLFTTAFGSDRGVIFELYNEPSLTASAANWQLWLNGGEFKVQSYLGMQTLANHIRGNGAQNVFVVDGLGVEAFDPSNTSEPVSEASATLENVQTVADPLNRVVYAVHPYQHGLKDESLWDEEFGIPSKTLPVWADEWSAPTELRLGLGSLNDFQVAVDFVNYAQAHSIPICTGAFDVTRFVVSNVAPWTYNNYDNYSSSSLTEGSGTLMYNDFLNNYSKPMTREDAL
jgi:endoglucanase